MIRVVLDAGVAAKWFLPPQDEQLVTQALHLFRRYEAGQVQFIVPDIFWAEFGNIAWKAVRRQRWRASAARRALESIRGYDFPTVDSKSLMEDAFEIASAHGSTVYDALYVALAVGTEVEMVTADEHLAHALAARFPVKWLGAFSIT